MSGCLVEADRFVSSIARVDIAANHSDARFSAERRRQDGRGGYPVFAIGERLERLPATSLLQARCGICLANWV